MRAAMRAVARRARDVVTWRIHLCAGTWRASSISHRPQMAVSQLADSVSMHSAPSVLILFGSQTGNAQEICKLLHADIKKRLGAPLNSRVRVLSMKQFVDANEQSVDTLPQETAIIIVCSTTGNGDPPDNALKFVRLLERKKEAGWLSRVHYTLLGLGDSNYDNFNKTAKVVNSRLEHLGAKPFFRVSFADDATGLEDTVEPWRRDVIPALHDTLLKEASKPQTQDPLQNVPPSQPASVQPNPPAALAPPVSELPLAGQCMPPSDLPDAKSSEKTVLFLYGQQSADVEALARSLHSATANRFSEGAVVGTFPFAGSALMSMKQYITHIDSVRST